MFTIDLDLDPLLLKVSKKIDQRRLDRMKQSSISYFIKKQSLKYSDSYISENCNNIVFEKNKNSSDKKNLHILLFFSLYNTLHLEETSPAYFFQNLAEKISFLPCISNLQSSICNHSSKIVPSVHAFF